MNLDQKLREHKQMAENARTEAFRDFMDDPLVRVTISAMPKEVTSSDSFNLLLSAAHERGFNDGLATAMRDITQSIMKAADRKQKE